ncbi:MAG: T9SS type A sorting domain-containing protein [Bacteroidia bacterium]|jgi:hypothetical protein|nr:T9SS type A sorting domain-containing protein [Bacteroidia bacterium]
MLRTVSGFNTFSISPWPDNDPLFAITDGDSSVIILSGTGGEGMSISYNRGASWLPGYMINGLNGPINDVKFYNSDTIFAITRYSHVVDNFVYDSAFAMSYNKGVTWKHRIFYPNNYTVTNPLRYTLRRLYVKAVNEIYVLAHDNQKNQAVIFKTPNQGVSWFAYTIPFSRLINDMTFLNDSVALVCGNSGLLFKWNKIQATYTGNTEVPLEDQPINIFPNPVNEELYINFKSSINQSNSITFNLSDVTGKTLKSLTFNNYRSVNKIDLKDISVGMYFLHTAVEGRVYTFKVIKE